MRYPEIGAVRLAKTRYCGQVTVEWSVWQWQRDGQHHMQARGQGILPEFSKCRDDLNDLNWIASYMGINP